MWLCLYAASLDYHAINVVRERSTRILPLPEIVGRLAGLRLATDLLHTRSGFRLSQRFAPPCDLSSASSSSPLSEFRTSLPLIPSVTCRPTLASVRERPIIVDVRCGVFEDEPNTGSAGVTGREFLSSNTGHLVLFAMMIVNDDIDS